MERRLAAGPAVRAVLFALGAMPAVALLEGWLLRREGALLDAAAFARAVLLPGALGVLLTGAIFTAVMALHVLKYRDAMRRLAAGDRALGGPELMAGVGRDLLGMRETFDTMRGELDRALKRLAFADEQRRRLFADLAHELATPASALLALGDTLGQSHVALDDAERARLNKALEGETLRVARLVEDIRDLAELDDPDVTFARERADVAKVVAGAVERFAVRDGAPIELSAEPVFAEIDPMRVDQALTNLLTNARRHTPDDRSIRVAVSARGPSAVVIVEDGGPGVPPEALRRLGERLFRVEAGRDRRKGGHGLGLAIVRATLARHAGSTEFEASATGGLRVTLTIPQAP